MQRNVAAILNEMITAITGIEQTISGVGFVSFTSDWTKRHAVQRGIEIVSEASRNLPGEVLAQYPEIPWPKIKAVGDILRHEYHAIADEVIWNIAVQSLPDLKIALLMMQHEHGEGTP